MQGFVSRELLKMDDGTWLDIVHFENMEDAEAAAEGFLVYPSAKAFEEAIDTETAQMSHYRVAKKY